MTLFFNWLKIFNMIPHHTTSSKHNILSVLRSYVGLHRLAVLWSLVTAGAVNLVTEEKNNSSLVGPVWLP